MSGWNRSWRAVEKVEETRLRLKPNTASANVPAFQAVEKVEETRLRLKHIGIAQFQPATARGVEKVEETRLRLKHRRDMFCHGCESCGKGGGNAFAIETEFAPLFANR